MRRWLSYTRITIATIVCSAVLQACAGDTERANELIVEAGELVRAADLEPSAEEKLRLLDLATDRLNRIVDQYPSTNVAVKLATDEPIGVLSLSKVRAARVGVCRAAPIPSDISCFIEYVLAATEKIEEEDNPRAWALAKVARVLATNEWRNRSAITPTTSSQ